MLYRVTNIRMSNGADDIWSSPDRYTEISEADMDDYCSGDLSVKDFIEAELLNGVTEAHDVAFDFREIRTVRLVGVEAVTLGTVDRCYGGSEEGGWYYDHFTPLRIFYAPKSRMNRLKCLLERICDRENEGLRAESDTVLRLRSGVERETRRPYYC